VASVGSCRKPRAAVRRAPRGCAARSASRRSMPRRRPDPGHVHCCVSASPRSERHSHHGLPQCVGLREVALAEGPNDFCYLVCVSAGDAVLTGGYRGAAPRAISGGCVERHAARRTHDCRLSWPLRAHLSVTLAPPLDDDRWERCNRRQRADDARDRCCGREVHSPSMQAVARGTRRSETSTSTMRELPPRRLREGHRPAPGPSILRYLRRGGVTG
jgi:hypothetical protein